MNIKEIISDLLTEVLLKLQLVEDNSSSDIIQIFRPKDEKFGDFSSNIAMVLAKKLGRNPKNIAKDIVDKLREEPFFTKVELAGPGFINIFVARDGWLEQLRLLLEQGSSFGRISHGGNEKVLIEFVSANPTGPLHIGHGRGAALGDSLQRILNFAGFDVESEYYINDSGLQIENLGRSLIYRATELTNQSTDQLELLYKGDYLIPIARKFVEMIEQKKLTLDNENILELASEFATNTILADIKEELTTFNVKFNNWFSEKSLHDSKKVDLVIDKLLSSGEIYEKDGALWLKTESANDEKDRVVRRTNGLATYLAADIAYHEDKFNRGFAKIINIFGADHHGYIPRMKAVAKAIGREPDNLIVKLIQLVNLKRGGEIISMSTREGLFTSLNEIVNEVGIDACRYFFVNRSAEAKLDFDLDLAKLQTEENPVFYIQYAYARSASIFRLADERSIKLDSFDEIKETLLNNSDELRLIKKLLVFPEIVKSSADNLAPLHIADYLKELAALFHRFYKFNRIITEEIKESKSKLMLLKAVMITIKNGLNLLGVKAPERM